MVEQGLSDEQRARAQQVIRPHLPLLLRTAGYMTRHEQDAQDLVQDAVLKAMKAIDRFEPGTDARSWLLTILRRAHIDRVRQAQRRGTVLSLDAAEAFDVEDPQADRQGVHDEQWHTPQQLMERFEEQQIIEALRGLHAEIRWTLLLVDVEGLDLSEAARVLEVPVGTVKSRTHRGRGMLRDRLFQFASEHGWIAQGDHHAS
ncbi:sigma-70 family RNA polymerase sigma factor [Phycisphaerales bacterium AB-hyl4]|uniref:RNA polymerase sigma factor n=1 Tax=Natronomicrosphaera hydrolytica TaxID=3242702 RepID=A0ABV4UCG2_9BACT